MAPRLPCQWLLLPTAWCSTAHHPCPCTGLLRYCQILELYRQYIDPEFAWSNFTVEEQAKVIVAPRSNNLLDTTRVGLLPRVCGQG